ncbi:DnaJ-domain-containing protein [Hysterangium stoloniferum]|nr:DnaJ-domain-containing protein [Hysterangium stoloniferum]
MSTTTEKAATENKSQAVIADVDIDKLLSREASAFQREIEVERILKAFKLNPYDILDIDEGTTPEGIKKKYRQLSLFIHPDKTPHARAPEAFDLLKKAESELTDKDKREELDAVIRQARLLLLKELSLPTSIPDDDDRLHTLQPSFKSRLRVKSKELLIEEEVARRKAIKMNLANEGLEAKRKEEEINQKKRKAEEDKNWEENREQRVDSWRSFASAPKKKKKTKVNILG